MARPASPGGEGLSSLLFDSFWRAVASCLHRRVIGLSLLPLLAMGVLAAGLGFFFWDSAVGGMVAWLQSAQWAAGLARWLPDFGQGTVGSVVAPLLVVAAVTPLLVAVVLLLVALLMTPAMVNLVARSRFPALERRHGASFLGSALWSLGSMLLALLALLASMPLWLVPPLVLVLPPVIWGWLTYRVMAFDALADHATREERRGLLGQHRLPLLAIGIATGYLGAAPSVVWASGWIFLAAFPVLIPLALWIYTLVFAFSSLWFTHYCLAALAQARQLRP